MIECIALPLTAAQRLHNALKTEEVRAWCAAPSGHLSPVYGPEGKGGRGVKKPEVREENLRTNVLNVLMSCCKARTGIKKPLVPTSATGRTHVLNVLVVGQRGLICGLALAFTAGAGRGTIRLKPKGPVTEKHQIRSGCSPHRKAGFCHAQILGGSVLRPPHGFGRGGPTRKDGRTASDVFFTPRPPAAMKTQTVALVTPEGAKTMTTSPVASRSAAPTITPTTGNTTRIDSTSEEARAFALLQASSDATMAKLYLSRGNVPAARRKAVQLLKALQLLEVAA